MTVQHSNSADIDAADGVSLDRDGVPRAEAIVVDARFAGGPFVVDTTTLGDEHASHRVVLLEVPGVGEVALFPHEAIDLARALLSRVRYAQGGGRAMTGEQRRRGGPPPSPRQIIADARDRIALASQDGGEAELREVQQTMARLTVHSLAGRDPGPAYDYALVSAEAEDALRLAIAKRVYPRAVGRKSWRKPEPADVTA